jgi:pimeloyl-ACP methyl ester carboxylesterase
MVLLSPLPRPCLPSIVAPVVAGSSYRDAAIAKCGRSIVTLNGKGKFLRRSDFRLSGPYPREVTGSIVGSLVSNMQAVLVVLLAGFLAAPAGSAAPASTIEQQMTPYLTPQRVVRVGDGRTINLVCLGHGSPTVILAAGLGGWSLTWVRVQPALAKHTRVCAWDRAGYGFSSPSPKPQDIVHTTQDLERALKGAGIAGPYVMVGHSLGGFEALRFADLHRQNVVGMVLVDPDIPDRAAVDERLAPQFATLSRTLEAQDMKLRQDCAAQLTNGTLKSGTAQFAQCTDPRLPAVFSRLQTAIARLNADPTRLLTQVSTQQQHYTDAREVINARRRYGDMPLIVLTAGRDEQAIMSSLSRLPPSTPGASTPEELAQLHEQIVRFLRDGWSAGHDAYAALSTRGRHQLVPDSTHGIPDEKPDVVISAVIKVLDESHSNPLKDPIPRLQNSHRSSRSPFKDRSELISCCHLLATTLQ